MERAWEGGLPVAKGDVEGASDVEAEREREGVERRQVEMQSTMHQEVFARSMAHPPTASNSASSGSVARCLPLAFSLSEGGILDAGIVVEG